MQGFKDRSTWQVPVFFTCLIMFFLSSRLALTGEEYEKFWKDIQFTVDKDVVRTDRSHPFFAGQDNPNVEKMR